MEFQTKKNKGGGNGKGRVPRPNSGTGTGPTHSTGNTKGLRRRPAVDGDMAFRTRPSVPMAHPEPTPSIPVQKHKPRGKSQVQSIDLLVNHFPVNYDERTIIFHYEFSITPEEPPPPPSRQPNGAIVEVSKADTLSIKTKLFNSEPTQFPPSSVAYDGNRNLYSVVPLPTGQFTVELRRRTYVATLEFKKELKFSRLSELPPPRDVQQCLDVAVKVASVGERIAVGRSLYSKRIEHARDLGRGIVVLQGSQQTIRCTEQGPVLCLDHSVMPFRKPGPVLQFVEENLRIQVRENTQLSKSQRLVIESALRGLRVTVTHRRTNQRFTVSGLTRAAANDVVFRDESSGRELRLVDYYRRKYNVEIRHKRLPCLDLSKDQMNYVPIEFCELDVGLRYPKDGLDWEAEKKVRELGSANPRKRKELILRVITADDGPCSGELANSFNISVAKEMTQIAGRVLDRPALKLGNAKGQPCKFKIMKDDCQWNLLKHKLTRPQRIDNWAILDFSANPSHHKQQRLDTLSFVPNLVGRCGDLGIQLHDSPLFVRESGMAVLSNSTWLHEQLSAARQSPEGRRVELLICPMSDRHPGYKTLKLICDTELGMVTQCCLSFHVNNPNKKDQYLANLALKINAKMGGSNAELFDGLPCIAADGRPFMLIGADVNHPASRNTTSPSIAAVVGSLNCPQSNRYAARLHAQPNRVERIVEVGAMCRELVDAYAQSNGVKPEKIIYFRDGVSDGQFDMVLNEEVRDLKAAIGSKNYSPTITVIVAQKRHHTRLFNKHDGVTRTDNVPPGTVVDSGIVDPNANNFYLCSHYGSLGTSKPTHYYVLQDEHGFASDELQRLIYNLCFTFARCTKPVSLVPPVYYADMAAYRGRQYYEGLLDLRSPGSTASSSSIGSVSSVQAFSDHSILPRVQKDLEDRMFYL